MALSICTRRYCLFLPKSEQGNLNHRSHQIHLLLCYEFVGAKQPQSRSCCLQIRPRKLRVMRKKNKIRSFPHLCHLCHRHDHFTALRGHLDTMAYRKGQSFEDRKTSVCISDTACCQYVVVSNTTGAAVAKQWAHSEVPLHCSSR